MMRANDQKDGALQAMAIAWLIAAVYYFYQYVLRAAPAVMIPQLTSAFGLSAVGLASLVGFFYFGYAPFSLVAGVAMDQIGPRMALPLGAAIVGLGALLFATGNATVASAGRFLQGAGGVFALVGAVYIATTYFPASRAATLIGATQMFGMAGGSAGQFLVAPLIVAGMHWRQFWSAMGIAGFAIAALLYVFIPSGNSKAQALEPRSEGWMKNSATAIAAVFRNPQSILCGLISGLLFLPTTIFGMVWGVRFLEESHGVPYAVAVMRSASLPLGWIIGCPLLGALSDRLGLRKPVIVGGAVVLFASLNFILYGSKDSFPAYSLGLVAGIASGAAMLPYTVIKEANPPEHGGTATGVINFINFSLSALLGPVFGTLLANVSAGGQRTLGHYQFTFGLLIWGVAIAIILTFFLRETGAARGASDPHSISATRSQ